MASLLADRHGWRFCKVRTTNQADPEATDQSLRNGVWRRTRPQGLDNYGSHMVGGDQRWPPGGGPSFAPLCKKEAHVTFSGFIWSERSILDRMSIFQEVSTSPSRTSMIRLQACRRWLRPPTPPGPTAQFNIHASSVGCMNRFFRSRCTYPPLSGRYLQINCI